MSKTFGLKNTDLKYIIDIFNNTPEIEKAFIFGSRSIGNFKKGSDVDIAIEGHNISTLIIAHLKFLFEENSPMPYFFDIVDYTHLKNSAFKKMIFENRALIYSRN